MKGKGARIAPFLILMFQSDKNNSAPLSTHVQYVKGVGPALASRLARMNILTVADLLALMPIRYIDRRNISPIFNVHIGETATIKGTILFSGIGYVGRRRRRIFKITISDDTGIIEAKFFYFHQRYFEKRYAVGRQIIASGEVTKFMDGKEFVHPEIEMLDDDEYISGGRIVPVYPLTEGVYQKTMRKIIRNAWDKFNIHIHPIFPQYMVDRYNLSDPWTCLQEIHFPSSDLDPELLNFGKSLSHRTLIFDEFFFLELGLAVRRRNRTLKNGISFSTSNAICDQFLRSLPFSLTNAQKRVLSEISDDMKSERPMSRLLQGDVGSGKTVVALTSAIRAISSGYQVAFMAPTEILAEQHFSTLLKLASKLDIKSCLLTGSVTGKSKSLILNDIEDGKIDLIVGTHALIQKTVKFKKLGFVIVDEQHRFGVMQRATLMKKACMHNKKGDSIWPDVLIMTATPIPRTLAMTLYGDLEVSVIDEMPLGRKPIITKLYDDGMRKKLYAGIRKELKGGKGVFVVYPLIEESEKLDLKNATDMSIKLKAEFEPDFKVDLLHGRMKGDKKERIMRSFKSGNINVLVATSVVEVGVDIPDATVMVIEHAERFGLSQLHQLRGRVGRSKYQSYCILVADYKRSEDAKTRLEVMVKTTDGFKIAEEDLKIRGPGEFLGTKQSGLPPFRIANIARDTAILSEARKAAFEMLKDDPNLEKNEHEKIRELLFSRWNNKINLADVS